MQLKILNGDDLPANVILVKSPMYMSVVNPLLRIRALLRFTFVPFDVRKMWLWNQIPLIL